MKKTMFKKVFAGIAAVFTLGLCFPTGFSNVINQQGFEAIAEGNAEIVDSGKGWTLDKNGLLTVFPETTINRKQFKSNLSIKEVTIGDNCTVNPYAFDSCTSLTSVTIGNDCTVDRYAFNSCTSLTSVTIGNDCTVDTYAFGFSCTPLESVTIGNDCTVNMYAFGFSCTSLTNVIIGDNCTVNTYAFNDCTSLTNVTMDYGCTIESMAFDGCNSIQKVFCIGDKNTVTVDDHNLEIICNKDKWLTATKCSKCQGPAIDYKCALCGYFDEAAAQAEIEKHEAEIDRIQKLIDENTTNGGNTASTFSDGSILAIIGGSTFLILCGLAAVIIVKRRKKTE